MLATSAWWYRRYASTHGFQLPVRPWALILAATIIVGSSASQLGVALDKQWISDFGPCLALAVGTGLTAYWLRWRRLALTAAMVVSTALVSLVAEGDLAVSLQLAGFRSTAVVRLDGGRRGEGPHVDGSPDPRPR